MGIFQLSGGGITRFLIELEPSRVEDLMAMVALYRPGPMPNIPEYIKRKHNPKLITYYVPEMEKWMKDSYGILVYQDDLLYTVIELAGYDWAEVDVFRKGVGKKIRAVIESQHEKFVLGCQSHSGLSAETAEFLWSLMEPFAAYGFNKAHAASYGMVSYWTAYMKGEFTIEFMTTLMTQESNNLDKVAAAIKECQELNIEVLAPDINESGDSFTIVSEHQIRYGLGSVKNLGSDVIKFIIKERDKKGRYETFDDFLSRLSGYNGFNKRSLEALIHAGCFDNLGLKVAHKLALFNEIQNKDYEFSRTYVFLRSFLFNNVESILEALTALKHGSLVESDSLFGFESDQNKTTVAWNLKIKIFDRQQILSNEKEALGIYLTENPMHGFEEMEQKLQNYLGKQDMHLALVTKVKKIFTKTNSLMFALQVITPHESLEAVIFPKNALELSSRLEENKIFWIKGRISQPKPKKKDEQAQFEDLVKTDESLKKMLEVEDPDFAQETQETEGNVQEYEEQPKILVENLIDFTQGILPLLDKEKDREKFSAVLEPINWTELLIHPENILSLLPARKSRSKNTQIESIESYSNEENSLLDSLSSHLAQEDQNSSFDYNYDTKTEYFSPENIEEALTKPIEAKFDQKQETEPTIIKISINDGPTRLKFVKSKLQLEPQEYLSPVLLEVEVEPDTWKRTKKIYYVDLNQIEV
jgi:DNA polymerase-3 subunit alpha